MASYLPFKWNRIRRRRRSFLENRETDRYVTFAPPPPSSFLQILCFCFRYFTQSELNHHMNSHSNIKKYQCQYCSNQYMAKNHLNRHISTVHMKAKIRCQVIGCTSDFPRKDRYRAHILSHHQNLGPDFVNQLLNGIKDVPIEFSNNNFQLA